MSFDISRLLEQWEYQPGQIAVRKFKAKNGKEKVQLRVDLGLLQMNAEGRPDGKRPMGHESLLTFYRARLDQHRTRTGSSSGFALKNEDCAKLQQEAIQYYHRYICLFELGDFPGVLRDTTHNMEILEFIADHAGSAEVTSMLHQFKPPLILMRTRAEGALALQTDQYARAIEAVESALDELREFYREQSRQDLLEQSPEIQVLEQWLADIRQRRPLSELEKLQHALKEAVGREDYEKAAQVRDALKNLGKKD